MEEGAVGDVLGAPSHPHTQDLVSAARRLHGALERMLP